MVIGAVSLTVQDMLPTMDMALADEIKEQQHKSARYVAVNGKLVSENNGRYIYDFSLEDPWDPEDDTPITIKFPGTSAQISKAAIVNSAGTSVKLAAEKALPPEALQKVLLVDDSTQLLERLRETLKSNDEGPALLGSKSFGLLPYSSGNSSSPASFGSKFSPNASQRQAIGMALGSAVTYIIGPPGTGKTYTLAAIAFAHLCAGRTVLIAAHTNIAIDNAIMRLIDICTDSRNSIAFQALTAGQIIRYGTPQLEERLKAEYSSVHLPSIVARQSRSLNQRREELRVRLNELSQQITSLEQDFSQVAQQWQAERQQLAAQRDVYIGQLHVLQEREQERLADLGREHSDLLRQRELAQQQVALLAQRQADISNQQVQLRTALARFVAHFEQLETQLASAQQMNRLKRFLKGISTQALSRQHADYRQKWWSCNQDLTALQRQMEELYTSRACAEQQVARLTTAISVLEAQRSTSSAGMRATDQLRASISKLDQDIAQIDAYSKPTCEELEHRLCMLKNQQAQVQEQIEALELQLADIEKKIIAKARIIATTLTKTYMNSNTRERRFDVVIMDEVSMAPLPAVYIAASHTDQSVVFSGDPQQLSPIVQSDAENAKAWLGRDLFAVRQITLSAACTHRYNSVMLTEQARMDPRIASIARQYIYQGLLEDSPCVRDELLVQRHARVEPLPGKPLLLCDTGDASPIATAPLGKSRINAYHALCAIELARRVRDTLPKPESPLQKGEFRIGLITPYSKQAQLLQQLVKDAGLTDEVRAGTVHRFQGLKAEVIIFDTVESPGGLRPSRLTTGGWGSDAMRLTNVAMTRAKHKLIVVANYPYLQQQLGEQDTLRLALQETHKAGTILSSSFLHLSSHTTTFQYSPTNSGSASPQAGSIIRPGAITSSSDYVCKPEFLDETTFFQRFEQDVSKAKKQVIIFSPFIEKDRTEKLIPLLTERRKAGIAITVVCRSGSTSPSRQKAEELLRGAGVQLRQPDDITHEKFVFIDDEIAYVGSLNPLSQNKSTEFMERVKSPSYVRQLKQFKQVDAIAKAPVVWGPAIEIAIDALPTTSPTVCK